MKIKLPYGSEFIEFEVPQSNLVGVVGPRKTQRPLDLKSEIKRALDNPIASKPLKDCVKLGQKIAIIVDNWRRPWTPTKVVLDVILGEFERVGIRDENVTIVIAGGMERPCTESELKAKLGKHLERFKVTQQNIKNWEDFKFVGFSYFGNPILVNRYVADANFVMGIGSISIGSSAGFGGGSKIILPGVSSKGTIDYNHIMSLSPKAGRAKLDGNPCREEMNEAASLVGLDFIINAVVNERNETVKIFAGDYIKAHREAVKAFKEIYEVSIPSTVDIAITDTKPFDIEIFEAFRAFDASNLVTKREGVMILVGVMDFFTENIESVAFDLLKKYRNFDDLIRLINRQEIGGALGSEMFLFMNSIANRKVMFVSDRKNSKGLEELGFAYFDSIEVALQRALREKGKDAKVLVMKCGGSLLPRVVQK
ncbi:nickel-dependent lactate racemase [Candidatus Bathyarchaeota archaeon]|nr:nickel-dependent lactate racemase [Candidatus Bathyarchaeota archaeon]